MSQVLGPTFLKQTCENCSAKVKLCDAGKLITTPADATIDNCPGPDWFKINSVSIGRFKFESFCTVAVHAEPEVILI